MITSKSNPTIKRIRHLQASRRFREQDQAYVVESTRWLKELALAGINPETILVTESWLNFETNSQLVQEFSAPVQVVSDSVLAYASELESPAGILAIVPMFSSLRLPEQLTWLLILDGISDPGNMGAILRTAAAAGVDGVMVTPGSVDRYNPKVIRAGMGAHLHLPIMKENWSEIRRFSSQLTVYLADVHGGAPYNEVDWCKPTALIIGSEALGAGKVAQELCDEKVRIPMTDSSESLNAAVATGILLFEAARQRGIR
jgi:TrmH family RNA methyltransferase